MTGTRLTSSTDVSGLRIAVVNWRDPWHPQAGGAERYAWEMARALHGLGARVRFLTARARGQAGRERRNGIEIVRIGGRFTVYPRVLCWLLARRRSFDAVLDCQNGIPFFTPLVLPSRVPVLCVMHHVHTAQFGVHFGRWMAGLGRLLEGPAARRVYRRHACVAVSPSTVTAMRERLRWTGDIYLIPNGTARPSAGAVARSSARDLVWVGRLVAHKRVERLIPVAERLRLREERPVVEVVGHGPAAEELAAEVALRGLDSVIRLRGFVDEPAKQALVAGSLLHLNTSQGEGWGLCVLEAAALGVPTVAYDVEGLRDAIRDGETGWLVREGEQLADVVDRALKELSNPGRRQAVASACRQWAARFDWGRSTARMAALIHASVQAGTSRARRPGAWIVAGPDGDVLAEGPVLDRLVEAGAEVRREATPLERLTGPGETHRVSRSDRFSSLSEKRAQKSPGIWTRYRYVLQRQGYSLQGRPYYSEVTSASLLAYSGFQEDRMRRVGLVLAGLGTCLIVFALLMVTWVSSTVIKFPLNQYASVTLTDSNASYFSPSKLIPLTGVTMEATYTIKGNAAAGSDSTAVWNQFLYVYDQTNKLPFQTMTRTFAFDRRTAELVNCCGAHVNGNSSVQQTGYVGILLPIGTEKKTYPVFDPNILKTVPFHYVGLDEVGGTEAYKFNGIVPPTQTGTQTVPGSLVNQSGASVTLPQYFESDTTYWIDPVTGALLNVTERQKVTLRNSSGAQALLLFDANLAATSTSIDSLVAIDNAQLSKASFVSTLLPLVSGIVGAILLVVGLLLWRRPRQEADVEAGRSPGASELAAAGPEGGAPAAHVSLVPGLDDQPREATATAEPKEASPMLRAEAARPQAEAEQTKGAEAADKPAAPQPAAGATAAGAAAAKDDGAPAEAPTAEMTAVSADPAASDDAVSAEDTGDSVSADDASDSRRGRPGAHRR